MTKSTITREESVQAVFDLKVGYPLGLADIEILKRVARMALAAMDSEPVAWLAIYHGEVYDEAIGITRSVVEAQADHFGWGSALTEIIPLFRHAQPAPVVSADLLHTAASAIEDLLTTKDRTGAGVWFDLPFQLRSAANAKPAPEYPETLPCPVLLEPGMRFGKGVKTRLVLDAIQRRAEHHAELEAMAPEERAEYDAGIEAFKAMLPQPALVVPDEIKHRIGGLDWGWEGEFNRGWNACRAAMLNGGKS